MFKRRVRTDNEISEMISLELGGFPQKVLIEGRRKDLPIMVVLHGVRGRPSPDAVSEDGTRMSPTVSSRCSGTSSDAG